MQNLLGMTAPELGKVFAQWNQGDLDSLPDPDHRRHPPAARSGAQRRIPRRLHPRHRRPEGHRQVDQRQRAGHGHPRQLDCRGGLRPLPVGAEGRARRRRASSSTGPKVDSHMRGQPRRADQRHPRRALLLEDLRLRPGLPAHARGPERIQLEAQLRRDRGASAAAGASSAPASSRRSPTPTRDNADLVNLLLDPYFNEQIKKGQANWRQGRRPRRAQRHRRPGVHVARSRTTTATAPHACRPTCSRPSATTSAPTPTSAPTRPAAVLPPRLAGTRPTAGRHPAGGEGEGRGAPDDRAEGFEGVTSSFVPSLRRQESKMYNTRAYSAKSATSPLASTMIPRGDPTDQDVQIGILTCGICHSDLHHVCRLEACHPCELLLRGPRRATRRKSTAPCPSGSVTTCPTTPLSGRSWESQPSEIRRCVRDPGDRHSFRMKGMNGVITGTTARRSAWLFGATLLNSTKRQSDETAGFTEQR